MDISIIADTYDNLFAALSMRFARAIDNSLMNIDR